MATRRLRSDFSFGRARISPRVATSWNLYAGRRAWPQAEGRDEGEARSRWLHNRCYAAGLGGFGVNQGPSAPISASAALGPQLPGS